MTARQHELISRLCKMQALQLVHRGGEGRRKRETERTRAQLPPKDAEEGLMSMLIRISHFLLYLLSSTSSFTSSFVCTRENGRLLEACLLADKKGNHLVAVCVSSPAQESCHKPSFSVADVITFPHLQRLKTGVWVAAPMRYATCLYAS